MIIPQGDVNRDDMPSTSEDEERYFSGRYERRLLRDIGHFVPREDHGAVVKAARDLP